jgi:hypothetical protein
MICDLWGFPWQVPPDVQEDIIMAYEDWAEEMDLLEEEEYD